MKDFKDAGFADYTHRHSTVSAVASLQTKVQGRLWMVRGRTNQYGQSMTGLDNAVGAFSGEKFCRYGATATRLRCNPNIKVAKRLDFAFLRKKSPKRLVIRKRSRNFTLAFIEEAHLLNMVGVVQLVRASDCGSECRGFESHPPPENGGVSKFAPSFKISQSPNFHKLGLCYSIIFLYLYGKKFLICQRYNLFPI